jgi:hypothetical protein
MCNRRLDRQVEALGPNPPRTEVLYHKIGEGFGSSTISQSSIWIIYDKLEKDLDCLSQVEGAFGSSTTSWRWIWIAYYKSEEDLDRLLQVREGPASIYRMAPAPADYSDFINNTIPLPKGHHGLMAPQSW